MRSRALSLVAIGIMVVALDFRVVAFDVLPDVVGWLLVAAGAWKLACGRPAALALVAAVASLPDVIAPHHFDALDPITGEVVVDVRPGTRYPERLAFDRLSDLRLALAVIALVAGGAALWSMLGALRARAAGAGDESSARQLRVLRWLVMALWVAPYVLVALGAWARDGSFDPVWNGSLELIALLGLVAVGGLAWMLVVNSNRIWTATGEQALNPWSQMTSDHP